MIVPREGFTAIAERLAVLLVFLERPVVQLQILAFIVALALAWGLSDGIWRLFREQLHDRMSQQFQTEERQPIVQHILFALGRIEFPLLGLGLVWAVQVLFRIWGQPAGLLGELVFLLWLILLYRLIVALLVLTLGAERVRPFRVRLLAPIVGVFAFLRVLGLLIDLGTLGQVRLLTVAETPILLGGLFSTIIVLYFVLTGTWAVQNVVERAILPRTAADPGMVNALLTVARYIVIILGISFALGALGFDTSTIAFISGGLTVAIGFGSQQVFANMVSGLLLLFDQSLRPGDVISVAGEIGVVENLSIRATTMRTADNVAVVMPNQSFITGAIRNYSKTTKGVRLQIPIVVAFDGEPRFVRKQILETVREHPAVLFNPVPQVYYSAFGKLPSGTNRYTYQLTAWLSDPLRMVEVTSDLLLAVHDTLAAEEIEMV
jgi:potassium-dependent mechanosensitive channel